MKVACSHNLRQVEAAYNSHYNLKQVEAEAARLCILKQVEDIWGEIHHCHLTWITHVSHFNSDLTENTLIADIFLEGAGSDDDSDHEFDMLQNLSGNKILCGTRLYLTISFLAAITTAPPIGAFVNPAEPPPQADDIRTEFHPSSGRPSVTEPFETYGRRLNQPRHPLDETESPWSPFQTRADFELAEFVLDACLNTRQVNTLLKLNKDPDVTFRNDNDLKAAWEHASNLLTPVCQLINLLILTINFPPSV